MRPSRGPLSVMLEDPAVQEMMKRFDATVVPESFRPPKSEEVGK
ncbi:MAG: hypothetical protein Ct9H300mP14_14910 [Gammaproteobacteria bacterium]|nr:MAG: hypothetical protein Ct9H300mP14_14910 [Gammaproteobacteria bacterium]